jgi:hypothetical protein
MNKSAKGPPKGQQPRNGSGYARERELPLMSPSNARGRSYRKLPADPVKNLAVMRKDGKMSGSMLSKARVVDARADAELGRSSIQNSLFMRGEHYRRRRSFAI